MEPGEDNMFEDVARHWKVEDGNFSMLDDLKTMRDLVD